MYHFRYLSIVVVTCLSLGLGAFKDQESSWKMAVEQEGLSEVPDNFFITNPKNSKMLEKLKLELIPRYIIFDKQGNIVEKNAPRPSDKQVTTTIDKYLK